LKRPQKLITFPIEPQQRTPRNKTITKNPKPAPITQISKNPTKVNPTKNPIFNKSKTNQHHPKRTKQYPKTRSDESERETYEMHRGFDVPDQSRSALVLSGLVPVVPPYVLGLH
jgi:hypothetical protein